jgi:signal peptidase I
MVPTIGQFLFVFQRVASASVKFYSSERLQFWGQDKPTVKAVNKTGPFGKADQCQPMLVSVSKGTVVYIAAFALLLLWAFFVQADTRRVDGQSMLPTLEGGDLVVIQSVPVSEVHIGDIVVYGSPCSTGGESVVHRVVNITNAGLVTKGDNNLHTDQYMQGIAVSPITQQCLEGKVVFVVPYVELLAYYIDANGLPQWLNYIPSILILVIVIALTVKGDEGEKHRR